MLDKSKVPYNDRFDPKKDYNQLLFHPDRALQNSELNEMQSISRHYLSRLGNTILVDGDIQEGMEFNLTGSNIEVSSGEVYLGGQVRTFNKQSIPFVSVGTFKVCVALRQEVITSVDDATLLDQTSGVPNFYSPGADRLKESLYLTADETVGVPIYEFRDGDLHLNRPRDRELSRINDILAERTNDESGSYKVRGFNIFSEPDPINANNLRIVVDSGRAYVVGYQVDKPTPTRIMVPKAMDKNTVQSEAFFYNNTTRRGSLGNSPVASVNRVTAQVQVTKESVNRGVTSGSSDNLLNASVVSVIKVWREEGGVEVATYQQGTDFQVVNGNSISWAPTGSEPPAGGTYFVTYVYNKTMVRDTDYRVVTEGNIDNRRTFIDFNGVTGNRPVADTMVLVDYEYYLAREDLILIDKEGEIFVQEGQPDSLNRVKKPSINDPYLLVLGSITIYPNSITTIPHVSTLSRVSMQDLQNMKNRIQNLEYNQALNALDQPAMEDINPTVLRGVFSDGFISMSKYDSSHPDAKIGFSFEDAQITLPYASADKKRPQFMEGSSNAHTWGRLITAPFTEERAISQPHATDTMNINPYSVFNNQGVLKLTPSEDNWIDEERITVVETQDVGTLEVRQWWKHPNDNWVEDEKARQANITLDGGVQWEDVDSNTHGTRLPGGGWRWSTDLTTSQLEAGGTRTQESIIDFMRPIDITFEARNLTLNTNNLIMNFDGRRVPVTPASGFSAGTEPGSIRSNAQGVASGTFRIPSGVRTGVREVMLGNVDTMAISTFVAEGQRKVVEDVIIRKRQTITLVDPLAQSFQFRENRIVSSFDLFFASKDTSKRVTAQVRGITPGGMPDKTIYAERLLEPSEINVSNDASVATKITFDDPLVVDAGKEYALVLLTDSGSYTVWIATRGEVDINTGNRITSNPYLTGVLYSSSNASAWSIHQDSDLKFNVNTAMFNETALLQFDAMQDVSADAVVLMATYLTPENTGCVWEVKMVMENESPSVTLASKPWVPLANYEEIELNQIARSLQLRAHFRTNRHMSPIMSLGDLLLTSFLSALSGSYVSRTINTTEAPYNKLRLTFEAFEPGNSSVVPRFSTDNGQTWREFTVTPTTQQQTNEFVRYVYEEKVTTDSNGYASIKFRLDFSTQNSFIRPRARRLQTNFTFE